MSENQADLAKQQGKKKYVQEMFNSISRRYDLMDRILSLGIDISWRKKAIVILNQDKPKRILDVATGTADLAIQEAKSIKPDKIIGVDISDNMLEVGRIKVFRQGLQDIIDLQSGDSENLNFEDNFFDAVSVSFGVRNFENLEKGLGEMLRVLRKGGRLMILEFSLPRNKFVKWIYLFYFSRIVPFLGKLIAGNSRAYQYLPDSVNQFPYGDEFIGILKNTGFRETKAVELSFGICTIYTGIK
ncbi:bifunctional demethylmenaquinone methyltransferase/2-methoxy-6-polyprenyl-1,4-benzoquinol methylase UbiE [Bacteroidota bacterium]